MTVRGDFLVIGSGIAGLRAAISLAERGDVIILTKADLAATPAPPTRPSAVAASPSSSALRPTAKSHWYADGASSIIDPGLKIPG